MTARRKSKLAEENSDLSSNEERKRKPKRNPIYSSDDEEDCSVLPGTPKISLAKVPKLGTYVLQINLNSCLHSTFLGLPYSWDCCY